MKIDNRQKEAIGRYANLLKNKNIDLAESVGRHTSHLGLAQKIWSDISNKLQFSRNNSLLDIGCGFGELTSYCIEASKELDLSLHLLDIPDVITRIKDEMSKNLPMNVAFWNCIFPNTKSLKSFPRGFDFILAYSVIHYTDEPEIFIDSAVSLLNEGGRLLIGDLPNVNKKGRFLSSPSGAKFEAIYKNKEIHEIPKYKDHKDFFKKCNNQNKKINDNLICNIVKKYRNKGFHVYLLPQPYSLPFSHTREDLLICRP
jgi:SAM-dependent methyltransferase